MLVFSSYYSSDEICKWALISIATMRFSISSIIRKDVKSKGYCKQSQLVIEVSGHMDISSRLGCYSPLKTPPWVAIFDFWSAKGIASPLLSWGSLCMTPSHMFLSIESRVWLSYGMWVKNPKTIVFWKSKTGAMKPRKTKKSSQHTLMEPQNLEART